MYKDVANLSLRASNSSRLLTSLKIAFIISKVGRADSEICQKTPISLMTAFSNGHFLKLPEYVLAQR